MRDEIPCIDCPLRTTGAFSENTENEIEFIQTFKRSQNHYTAGSMVIHETRINTELFTILSGWAFRYRTLRDGRRQILNFLLPGDLVGLQEQMAMVSPHGVQALTDISVCKFYHTELWSLYRSFPSLGYDITWLAAHEEYIVDENLLSVGQRSAKERIAMLLLHLYKRAKRLGLVDDQSLEFPVTQQHIADALGLSLVHTNKTMRSLQGIGLHEIKSGRLKILNPAALKKVADFSEVPLRPRPLI